MILKATEDILFFYCRPSSGEIQTAVVVANDELSATDSVKTYMEMVLEPSTPFTYAPGDSFAVICQNNDEVGNME